NQLERPFRLRVDTGVFFQATIVETFIQEKVTPIYGLPPKTPVRLEVRPITSPERVIRSVTLTTDTNVSPPNPAFPYLPCQPALLPTKLPRNSWLDWYCVGDEASAQSYYQRIGAIPFKDTFDKWLAANGFEP